MDKPRLEPQGEVSLHAPEGSESTSAIVQAAVHAIRLQTYGAIRDLSVEKHSGTLVIRGRCDRYYETQLAQEAVLALSGGPWTVRNEIVVAKSARRP